MSELVLGVEWRELLPAQGALPGQDQDKPDQNPAGSLPEAGECAGGARPCPAAPADPAGASRPRPHQQRPSPGTGQVLGWPPHKRPPLPRKRLAAAAVTLLLARVAGREKTRCLAQRARRPRAG